MIVIKKESGPAYTNGYLVYDEVDKNAVIIDAPLGLWNEIKDIILEKNLSINAILLTHTHWDHILDCNLICKETNADIYVHKFDNYRLEEPNKHTIFNLPFHIEPMFCSKFVEDNQIINFGNLCFKVIHTPGHTEGGICFYNEANNIIFTGDTLFQNSIGRTDFPGGSLTQLLESIKNKLLILPSDTIVYSGHGNPTTIGFDIQNNPFLSKEND